MRRSNIEYARVQISMPVDILARLDGYVDKTMMARSTIVSEAVRQYLEAMEQLPKMQEQVDELKSLLAELAEQNLGGKKKREKTPTV